MLVTWILFYFQVISLIIGSTSLPSTEYDALHDLYTVTHGDHWIWREPSSYFGYPWNFTDSTVNNPCSSTTPWQGIHCIGTCDDGNECQIEQIILHHHNLTGAIPESLVNITQLTFLALGDNCLTGTIPSILGELQYLLNLALPSNQLIGTIPSNLGKLYNLQYLYLYNNSLTGSIPLTLMNLNNLLYLFLSVNQLNSTIPSNIGNSLIHLTKLLLDNNDLTGSIPLSLGNLTNTLTLLYLQNNDLIGSIPVILGQLQELRYLVLYNNQFTNSIPLTIGLLTKLELLYIYANYLTGTIPYTLTNSTSLRYILLSENDLTGSIPLIWNNHNKLNYFTISNNFITGNIPIEMCNSLSSNNNNITFRAFEAYNNLLTGSIPIEISNLTLLNYFEIDTNEITGSIPLSISNLIHMRLFQIQSNQLTGSIPITITYKMNILLIFYCSNNYLTGNIYPLTIQPSIELEQLYLYNNFFTGSFRPSIINTTTAIVLTAAAASEVSLSSMLLPLPLIPPIPELEQHGLWKLQVLDLSNNMFTGSIDDNIFINSTILTIVSLNNNEFTGFIPSSLFINKKQLRSIVLSLNCFSGTLPDTICSSTNDTTINTNNALSQLILDGLHSASSCTTKAIPFVSQSGIISKTNVHGTIPQCLFQLSELNTLHLGGNSFSGLIPNIPISSSLIELVLSSNDLTGIIPDHLWKSNILVLDLSLNRLQGTLPSNMLPAASLLISNSSINANITIKLQVNQLSGSIPSILYNLPTNDINILEGNLFSCNIKRNNIPNNDPNYESYNCGSDSTNYTLIIFIMILFISCCLGSCITSSKVMIITCLTAYQNSYTININNSIKTNYNHIDNMLSGILSLTMLIAISCVVVGMSVYGGLSNYYSSYTYSYVWIVSAIYKSGIVASIVMLIIMLIGMITIICKLSNYSHAILNRNDIEADVISTTGDSIVINQSSRSKTSIVHEKSTWRRLILMFLIIMINIIVVISVNGLYVNAVRMGYNNDIIIIIALSVSIFKVLWNTLLLGKWKSLFDIIIPDWVVIAIVLFNNLIAPLIAELFISSDCFLYILSQAPMLSFNYEQYNCVEYDQLVGHFCDPTLEKVNDEASILSVSIIPPFHYSYQCSFSLISSYSYVFIFRYIISGMLLLIIGMLLANPTILEKLDKYIGIHPLLTLMSTDLKDNTTDDDKDDDSLYDKVMTIIEKQYLPIDEKYLIVTSTLRQQIIAIFVINISCLVCFGVLFPPLAFVIAISIWKDIMCIKIFFGKLQLIHDTINDNIVKSRIKNIIIGLQRIILDSEHEIIRGIWYGLCIGCGIWAFVLFDTLSSSIGATQSIWIAVVMACSPFLTYLLFIIFVNRKLFVRRVSHTYDIHSKVHVVSNPIYSDTGLEMRETDVSLTF